MKPNETTKTTESELKDKEEMKRDDTTHIIDFEDEYTIGRIIKILRSGLDSKYLVTLLMLLEVLQETEPLEVSSYPESFNKGA